MNITASDKNGHQNCHPEPTSERQTKCTTRLSTTILFILVVSTSIIPFTFDLSAWIEKDDWSAINATIQVVDENHPNGSFAAAGSSRPFHPFERMIPEDGTPDPKPQQVFNKVIARSKLKFNESGSILSSLSSCLPTSLFRLQSAISSDTHWILKTFSFDGTEKTIGGDEFYATYVRGENATTSPDAVAHGIDLGDGSYELRFFVSPVHQFWRKSHHDSVQSHAEEGTFNIVLQYTCGIGRVSPPLKNEWKTGGAINRLFQTRVPFPPHIFNLPEPTLYADRMRQYDVIMAFGDSMMQQFVARRGGTGNSTSNVICRRTDASLHLATVHKVFLKIIHKNVSRRASVLHNNNNTAVLIGSGVWDILKNQNRGPEFFDDHLAACRELIHDIRRTYPGIDIYWKSMTAMHIHQVKQTQYAKLRTKYMSSSRAELLYKLQLRVMTELNIPVLDVYNITYGSKEFLRPGDGRHYNETLNQHMFDLFFGKQ